MQTMVLMHVDSPVAELEMIGTQITKIHNVCAEQLPMGVWKEESPLQKESLKRWLESRSIPPERQGIARIQKALGCTLEEAQMRAIQVSLTDCYWVKPKDSVLTWNDVNYHDNGFSEDLLQAVMNRDEYTVRNFHLPDLTTDGVLEKTWVYEGDTPVLLKKGHDTDSKNLLSANEIIVSKIAEKLGFHTVFYHPARIFSSEELLCACPCFIHNSREEFVSALQIAKEYKVFDSELFDWFCKNNFEKELKDILYLDHLVRNTDRHERNFGIIRDVDTGNIRMAPIFDSGSCLDWDGTHGMYRFDSKPFSDDRMEQLSLLTADDISARHMLSQKEIEDIIQNVYEKFSIPEEQLAFALRTIETSHAQLFARTKEKGRMEISR